MTLTHGLFTSVGLEVRNKVCKQDSPQFTQLLGHSIWVVGCSEKNPASPVGAVEINMLFLCIYSGPSSYLYMIDGTQEF